MPLQLVRPTPANRHADAAAAAAKPRWTCAFVNNMPDSAFEATEQQYLGLLEAAADAADAAGPSTIAVTRHTMKGVPRTENLATYIDAEYLPLSNIHHGPAPDLLIVTGSNPVESDMMNEPYWGEMVELLTWAQHNVSSMLLSCFAAHAGLAIFDGLQRKPLASKCTGVFAQDIHPTHPLTAGLTAGLTAETKVLPHSRLNTVPVDQLRAAGYQVALGSDLVGWSIATKPVDNSDVILVQGHPEYGPESLLREYQRDVRRYVRGERDERPVLPVDCVGPEDSAALHALHERVTTGDRDDTLPALVEAFDFDQAGARAPWPWRNLAVTLYTNWLAGVGGSSNAANATSTKRSN